MKQLVDWRTRKLGDVCEVFAGQSPEGKYYNDKGIGSPFYQGKKEFTEKFIGEPTTWTTKTTKEAQAGDILMSVRAPVGPVNFATQKICIGRGLAAIRASEVIVKDYLFYFLLKHEEVIEGNAGAVFSSISKTQIESIEIPLPPLSDQQRIVAILDEAFAALDTVHDNAERNVVNARDLFESAQREIFASDGNNKTEIKKLGNIASLRNGINFTKNSTGETIKIVGVKDFQNRFWVPVEDLDSVRIDGNLNETDCLRKGDILAVRSNGNQQLIGRCILAGDVPEKTTHSGFTIRIRFESDNIFPEYLCHYLKSDKVKKQLISGGAGISIKSLNQTALSALPIPLPLLAEQHAIVRRLDMLSAETKRLKEQYESKLDAAEELRKSILQKAFEGSL